MPDSVPIQSLVNWLAYWVLFWSVVNILLPPREVFADASPATQKRYNTILMLVAYYGSLNLRQLTVKLYSSVDTAPVSKEEAKGFAKGKEAAKDAVENVSAPAVDPTKTGD